MYFVYLIINEYRNRTYLGFTDDIKRRIGEHINKRVKSTRYFGDFNYFILEKVDNLKRAREREKYWKSCSGRKRLKKFFQKTMAPSSSG